MYSIDEVFIDATDYLAAAKQTPREFAMRMILDVLQDTGVTATAGIGTNLYLCKIAMDIGAKHIEPDGNGVRIAELDEISYRRQLWDHTPITDFWRVGPGYAEAGRLGPYTMGDVARQSLGWTRTCCTSSSGSTRSCSSTTPGGRNAAPLADIKAYRPQDQQHRFRPGAHVPLSLRQGAAGHSGNGGRAVHDVGGKGAGDPAAGPGRGL